jgi:hypothetical protein
MPPVNVHLHVLFLLLHLHWIDDSIQVDGSSAVYQEEQGVKGPCELSVHPTLHQSPGNPAQIKMPCAPRFVVLCMVAAVRRCMLSLS